MRCQFCGWENPETKSACEKCNQPLQQTVNPVEPNVAAAAGSNLSPERNTQVQQDSAFNPRATVRENGANKPAASATCPKCGYDLDGEDVCPCCGESVVAKPQQSGAVDFKKTVRPDHNQRFAQEPKEVKGFSLTKLSRDEESLGNRFYEGEDIALNRDNTDPSNTSITSHVQAVVKNEDGKWMITDKSEFHSTYVQVSRPTELKDGDLILLGDQLFRFEVK